LSTALFFSIHQHFKGYRYKKHKIQVSQLHRKGTNEKRLKRKRKRDGKTETYFHIMKRDFTHRQRKDFSVWNERKKITSEKVKRFFYKKKDKATPKDQHC
jgi:hypothetical protein